MSPSLDTREHRAFAFEVKFVIDARLAARIRDWSRARLSPDPHAAGAWGDEYRTTSLYFDTAAQDVFRQRGSYGRTKFRVRRYGDSDEIFLERKLRNARMLSKRRTTVDLGELVRVAEREPDAGWAGAWFQRRVALRGLAPACQVSYQRMARVGVSAYGTIRLTIDDEIRALPAAGYTFQPGRGERVLDGRQILELKYRFAMPAVFKQLVEEFALSPLAISKYRLSVRRMNDELAGTTGYETPLTRDRYGSCDDLGALKTLAGSGASAPIALW
jgi:hypothetical protein